MRQALTAESHPTILCPICQSENSAVADLCVSCGTLIDPDYARAWVESHLRGERDE